MNHLEYLEEKKIFERNHKWGLASASLLKKQLLEKRDTRCCVCQNQFEKTKLELEHSLPASLGGDYKYLKSSGTDTSNYEIMCFKCHRKKTIIDRTIIGAFKKLGLIQKGFIGQYYFFEEPQKIEELYKYFFQKICEKKKREQ